MKKNKNNVLGIVAITLFIIACIIISLGFLNSNNDSSNYSGLHIIIAIIFSIIPFIVSFILSIVNIYNYHLKNIVNKCNKIVLVANWIIVIAIIISIIRMFIIFI